MGVSDPKSNQMVATHTNKEISSTHTTNGISTQKLLINATIQVVVRPITPLVTAGVVGAREILSPCQTILPQANIMEAARSCACIYWNPVKVSGMERDGATPGYISSSKTNSRLSLQSPSFVVTSVSPAQFREQDIVNQRHPGSIVIKKRNTEPFDTHINGSLAKIMTL